MADPLQPPELEAIAQRIRRRLPGCEMPDCFACANAIADAREFVRDAFALGVVASTSVTQLRRVASLLEHALEQFQAGEEYAHHARRPVSQALKAINQLATKEPNGNSAV